jgi:hypothetical protein
MIRHVVLLTWNDQADAASIAAMRAGLAALPELIPEVASYHFGEDEGLGANNADFAITAEFASIADYEVYATHPAHVEVIQTLIAPIRASRLAAQFATES